MIVTILDYSCSTVSVYEVPKALEELDGDDIVSKMGFKLSDVSYMISNNEELTVLVITNGTKQKLKFK